MSRLLQFTLKRAFDIVVSSVALILLSPLMAIIALTIRITMGSPILFCQQRPGLHGQPFTLCKFRTMTDARDRQGNLLPDAERLTSFGHFLRCTSLDELPELWNVLRGDMSLVGPRPLLIKYLERYTPEQARRHEVRPGVTGWAQVNGRNAISWEQKFALDVWYVDHLSFWLDLKIIALTLWKIIKREGISQPGHVTMEEFRGQGSEFRGQGSGVRGQSSGVRGQRSEFRGQRSEVRGQRAEVGGCRSGRRRI